MITFLFRTAIFLVSAALGLIVASLAIPGFHIEWNRPWGFILAIVIFAVLQSVLAPWVAKLARRHAPALLGGIGIISTLIALVIVVLIPGAGLGIDGPLAWIAGAVIVWIITALATWLLPLVFLKKKVVERG